jgi:hypothetical protein
MTFSLSPQAGSGCGQDGEFASSHGVTKAFEIILRHVSEHFGVPSRRLRERGAQAPQ